MEKKSNAGVVWTIVIVVIIIIIATVIYYSSGGGSSSVYSTPPSTISTTTDQSGLSQSGGVMIPYYTVLATTTASAGTYLAADNGMTLYTYSKDTAGVSNCTGLCATTWPPYTVDASTPLTASATVTGQLATITRSDGTTQVTYNGMPLYFFQSDTNPGSVTGNGVNGFSVAKP